METTGDLVAVVIELAARVEHRQHDLDRRPLLGLVHVHRDAAAIIVHRDRAIGIERHLNVIAKPSERLIHGVVYDLIDTVMQSAHARIANVHRRALAHGIHTAKHLDRSRIVGFVVVGCRRCR